MEKNSQNSAVGKEVDVAYEQGDKNFWTLYYMANYLTWPDIDGSCLLKKKKTWIAV